MEHQTVAAARAGDRGGRWPSCELALRHRAVPISIPECLVLPTVLSRPRRPRTYPLYFPTRRSSDLGLPEVAEVVRAIGLVRRQGDGIAEITQPRAGRRNDVCRDRKGIRLN